MIIDAILDRKDGLPYNEEETLKYIYDESLMFGFDYIGQALDYGDNAAVQDALAKYIIDNNYNPDLVEYVKSQIWLKELL